MDFLELIKERRSGGKLPFGEKTMGTLVDDVTVECVEDDGAYLAYDPFPIDIVAGRTYVVTFDGNEYTCVAYVAEGPNVPAIGNGELLGVNGGNGEPFFCTAFRGSVMFSAAEGIHTVSIAGEALTPIPKELLPKALQFGDEAILIEWDAATENRKTLEDDMGEGLILTYYKVSDRHLTADELVGATITVEGAEQLGLPKQLTVTSDFVRSMGEDGPAGINFGNFYVLKSIPMDGVYILLAKAEDLTIITGTPTENDVYMSRLKKNIVKPLASKYHPQAAVLYTNNSALYCDEEYTRELSYAEALTLVEDTNLIIVDIVDYDDISYYRVRENRVFSQGVTFYFSNSGYVTVRDPNAEG